MAYSGNTRLGVLKQAVQGQSRRLDKPPLNLYYNLLKTHNCSDLESCSSLNYSGLSSTNFY